MAWSFASFDNCSFERRLEAKKVFHGFKLNLKILCFIDLADADPNCKRFLDRVFPEVYNKVILLKINQVFFNYNMIFISSYMIQILLINGM